MSRPIRRLAAPMALAASLSGCIVLSIEPVIPESAAVFEPGLVGAWEDVQDLDRVEILRDRSSDYSLRFFTDHEVRSFHARTGRLGGRRVLEIQASGGDDRDPRAEPGRLIATHQLFAYELHGDRVRLAALDADTLRAALRDGVLRLSHLPRGDDLILTGPTPELRAALETHLARAGAWDEPSLWRRLPARGMAAPARPTPVASPCFEASPWPEADRLFRRDPHWVGADGASSIPLGEGRTCWLFGDSWIDPKGGHERRGARMIRNSVAIQQGTDPSRSTITFHWRSTPAGEPASFFPERDGAWYWPGHGIRLDGSLIVFLTRLLPSRTGLGFEPSGWGAVLIRNPDEEPARWQVTWLRAPGNSLGVAIGSAGVVRVGQYVHAFSSLEPVSPHPMYLVRWRVVDLARGDLAKLEWWGGADAGWLPDTSPLPRQPVFLNGQTDLSVHLDQARPEFLAFQTLGFGAADIAVRSAGEVTGPWSDARAFYRPPEFHGEKIMIYSGKAHPQLRGADVVLTYSTNSFDFARQFADSLLYYPRFVRAMRCR